MEPVRVMFNIGFGEFAIIFIVLILAVGPERLPTMMKTIGKTMRTLRNASRDLRASTGIDELMREDFDLYSPPKRAAPPPGPALVGRDAVLAADNQIPNAAVAATVLQDASPALTSGEAASSATTAGAAPSLMSDGPLTDQAPMTLPEPAHAALEDSLPSDAPAAPPEVAAVDGHAVPAQPPSAERDADANKPRES
jgi:sec-independent protein translocase protein TatB